MLIAPSARSNTEFCQDNLNSWFTSLENSLKKLFFPQKKGSRGITEDVEVTLLLYSLLM